MYILNVHFEVTFLMFTFNVHCIFTFCYIFFITLYVLLRCKFNYNVFATVVYNRGLFLVMLSSLVL